MKLDLSQDEIKGAIAKVYGPKTAAFSMTHCFYVGSDGKLRAAVEFGPAVPGLPRGLHLDDDGKLIRAGE